MDKSCPKYNIPQIFSLYNAGNPDAYAKLKGGNIAPCINGDIFFYQLQDGVYIKAYITGIPLTKSNGEQSRFHGFHIHQNGDCAIGTSQNPFPSTGNHFNPTNQPHPFHAGDLPPILSSNGIGILSVYTSYFNIEDIIGKSIILHENSDDFVTQPSGNSGSKLACGVIIPYKE